MREVFGEHGVHDNRAVRAIKPTEVGDAARQPNHDKAIVNTGRRDTAGCPRRGDRCGDRVKTGFPRTDCLLKWVQVLFRAQDFLLRQFD